VSSEFWWKNNGTKKYDDNSVYIDGWYHFCYNENGDSEFYIQEIDICYNNWSEEKRKDYFGDAKYVWGGCSGGVGYSRNILKADNIEDAKKEFEEWYEEKLINSIKNLENALNDAKNKLTEFSTYKENEKEK
jgi:hypothetical protein